MNTLKVVVAVFVRVVQLVANIACFVISLLRSREYNYLTLTVTSLNFIYNIYILVVVPLMNHKAYNGILFAIEIFFIVVYPIFSGIQTIIRPITTYWNYYSSDLYTIIASFVGFFCAATFLVSYILFVCWGVIPIVRHMDSEDFSKNNHSDLAVWFLIPSWLSIVPKTLKSLLTVKRSTWQVKMFPANKMLILQGNEGLLDETHTTKYGVTKIYNFYVKLILLIMYD